MILWVNYSFSKWVGHSSEKNIIFQEHNITDLENDGGMSSHLNFSAPDEEGKEAIKLWWWDKRDPWDDIKVYDDEDDKNRR